MEQSVPGNGTTDETGSDVRRVPEHGTLSLPEAAWTAAQRRAAVIGPLAARDGVSTTAARDAGRALGLSERAVYALLRRGGSRADWPRRSRPDLRRAAAARGGFRRWQSKSWPRRSVTST